MFGLPRGVFVHILHNCARLLKAEARQCVERFGYRSKQRGVHTRQSKVGFVGAVIVEATYGVSRHLPREEREQRFVSKIQQIVTRGGKV